MSWAWVFFYCMGKCEVILARSIMYSLIFTMSAFLVWCLGRQSITEYAVLVTSGYSSILCGLVSVIIWWSMQPAVHCPWSVLLQTFCWWNNHISVIEPLIPLNIVCCGACHLNSILSFFQHSSLLVRWSSITWPPFWSCVVQLMLVGRNWTHLFNRSIVLTWWFLSMLVNVLCV